MLDTRLFTGLLAIVIVGCAAAPDAEETSQRAAPIVNGSADTTHQAVVALFTNNGKCSATIVAVVGNQGYALTAAHCVNGTPPQLLLQGNDYNQSPIQYPIVDYAAHPLYDGTYYDFGMVRFTGAGSSTPVITPMSAAEDALGVGSVVDLIGYGQTENGDTSQRRHIQRPIASLTSLLIGYDQSTGGLCFGDSGGPAIALVNGQERIGGVSDFVTDTSCLAQGFSGRVSAVDDTFIQTFISGGPVGAQTCAQCFEASTNGVGQCVPDVQTCLNTPDCAAFLQCAQPCTTQACTDQCVANHAYGVQVYLDIVQCTCTTSCVTECQGDPSCPAPSACGFTAQSATCQSCFEANCCAQASACAADDFCAACFAQNPPAGCDQNALAVAFSNCVVIDCSAPCNIGTGGAGGAGGGPGPATTSVGVGGMVGATTVTTVTSASSGVTVGPTTTATTTVSGAGGAGGAGGAAGPTAAANGNDEEDSGCALAPPTSRASRYWSLALGLVILFALRRRRSPVRA